MTRLTIVLSTKNGAGVDLSIKYRRQQPGLCNLKKVRKRLMDDRRVGRLLFQEPNLHYRLLLI